MTTTTNKNEKEKQRKKIGKRGRNNKAHFQDPLNFTLPSVYSDRKEIEDEGRGGWMLRSQRDFWEQWKCLRSLL